MKSIGPRIHHIRTQKQLTLDELARRAGISKSFLWSVENGKSDISGENLISLANALGASIDFLLTGKAEEARESPIEFPNELSDMAEKHKLSFRETRDLLLAQRSMIARRGGKPDPEMTADQWAKLWDAVKEFLQDPHK